MTFQFSDLAGIPPLYSQEEVDDPIVYVKLFVPNTIARWYLYEASPVAPDQAEHIGFGWAEVVPGCGELGYVNLQELVDLGVVEKDTTFQPTPLSQCLAQEQEIGGMEL